MQLCSQSNKIRDSRERERERETNLGSLQMLWKWKFGMIRVAFRKPAMATALHI